MKIFLIIINLLFLHSYICVAQTQSVPSSTKAEDVKKAYMTKELNLTPEESDKFWPVYNNYFAEMKAARKQYLNDEVGFEERQVQIRKKYQSNFKNILNGNNRVNKVFTSEKNLKEMFRKELQNRQKNKRLQGGGKAKQFNAGKQRNR